MIRRIAVLLLAFAFVSCASAPNQLDEDQTPRSRYMGQAGESPVGVIPEGMIRDTERGKDLAFSVEYPTRPGSYPVIFFSPAFGATRETYVGLSAHWASQGYVVVRVAHADSGRMQTGGVEQSWRDQTATDWRNRVRDITTLIDSLDRVEESYPELKGKIDRAKIGVAGHSYGAFTAMLLAGARTFPGGTSYADPRVKALVLMSPQGAGTAPGFTTESFKDIRVPVLFMTGTADNGQNDTETPEWRRQAYELSPEGDKWLVVFEGGRHNTFTGRIDPTMAGYEGDRRGPIVGDPGSRNPNATTTSRAPSREGTQGMRIRNMFSNVKAITLAFFDTYLRGDAEGRTALEAAGSRGGIELLKK